MPSKWIAENPACPACPACPVAQADGTGVGPADRTGVKPPCFFV